MNIGPKRCQITALVMTGVMIVTSLPVATAQAGMVTTNQIIDSNPADDQIKAPALAPRERIEALLARADVRAEMIALGVDPAEAEARVAAMTETELAMLAGRLDQLPAGEGIGTILIIVFIVFGLAVLIDALGFIDIFPFVCAGGRCDPGPQAAAYQEPAAYPEPAAGPTNDYYTQGQPAPAYQPQRYGDPYVQGQPPRYPTQPTQQYYEPGPAPPTRNYYEERFGTQRQIR